MGAGWGVVWVGNGRVRGGYGYGYIWGVRAILGLIRAILGVIRPY